MYNSYYDSYNGAVATGLTVFAGIMIFLVFIILIAIAFEIISRWIFFKKCGEAGWKAIIPVYSDLTLLKVSELNWWWIFGLYASSILSIVTSSLNSIQQIYTNGYSYGYASGASLMLNFLIMLISLAGAAATIITSINIGVNISKKFGKPGGFAVLIVFFTNIMFMVLGLSSSMKYDKKVKVSPNGIFGKTN